MVKISLLFILLFIGPICHAQSIDKRYRSHLSECGTINFFRPIKLYDRTNTDLFIFDMTYISHSDSVTVNCSIKTKYPNSVKSFGLANSSQEVTSNNVSVLYRDVLKRGYEIRITSRFSFNDIQHIYKKSSPLMFKIIFSDNSSCTAAYSKSQWDKESRNITRILESINF